MGEPKTAKDLEPDVAEAIDDFFAELHASHNLTGALVYLCEAMVEKGEQNILDDPEGHGLRSVER